jgi:hypothetical protein
MIFVPVFATMTFDHNTATLALGTIVARDTIVALVISFRCSANIFRDVA